ncbi:MAG: L,D-transpeptidase family protein [Magnetococcales bacterium]|nr:L,D-transpeptidase family protein [Magnetococcales bacterium]MBF0323139.1 L,D-transpeptidase family protein [Magnetococcales bacterium]
MHVRLLRQFLFGVTLCSTFLTACTPKPPPEEVPPLQVEERDEYRTCPRERSIVQVDTLAYRLRLCHAGREEGSFRVALGRGGLNKRVEGDARTPLGRYYLGLGRPSDYFHTFIPVGYPTPEQKRQGYSGGAIGIHGPHQDPDRYKDTVRLSNWTLGCIAVPSREDIEKIAAWVKDKHVMEVVIQ